MGKLRIKARLGTCGRCGRPLGNPLRHVCVSRLDKPPRRRKRTKIRPKVSASVKCTTCGKPYANPLTHKCTVKTDFRRRLATASRGQRKRPGRKKPPRVKVVRTGPQRGQTGQSSHPYRTCRDETCERRYCVLWREARAEGYEAGHQDGHEAGYRAGHHDGYREGYKRGYDEGYAAGQAAAS